MSEHMIVNLERAVCAASEALTMQERTGHGCLSLCLCVAAVEGSTLFLAVSVTGNVSVVCVCLHGFDFFCFVRFFGEGFGGGDLFGFFYSMALFLYI